MNRVAEKLALLDNQVQLAPLQVLEDLNAKRSTVITSQLPVNKWYQYINLPVSLQYLPRK